MNKKIFDVEPTDWYELEIMVAQAFEEMGYESHRSHRIETVRGTVAVDVHAVNSSTPIPTTVLCECKYWNKRVNQNVVHGFRTVCSDAGAHFGVIISKKGFQSGAEKSREATNIHLLDFSEFQKAFFSEWVSGVFLMLAKMRDQLLPILRASAGYEENGLDIIGKEALAGVDPTKKYSIFFWSEGNYGGIFIGNFSFPIEVNDPRGNPQIVERITIHSHREYLEIAKEALSYATNHFNLPQKYFPLSE